MRSNPRKFAFFAFGLLAFFQIVVQGQSTGFTYQGKFGMFVGWDSKHQRRACQEPKCNSSEPFHPLTKTFVLAVQWLELPCDMFVSNSPLPGEEWRTWTK